MIIGDDQTDHRGRQRRSFFPERRVCLFEFH
jgi:hypothetical protein